MKLTEVPTNGGTAGRDGLLALSLVPAADPPDSQGFGEAGRHDILDPQQRRVPVA